MLWHVISARGQHWDWERWVMQNCSHLGGARTTNGTRPNVSYCASSAPIPVQCECAIKVFLHSVKKVATELWYWAHEENPAVQIHTMKTHIDNRNHRNKYHTRSTSFHHWINVHKVYWSLARIAGIDCLVRKVLSLSVFLAVKSLPFNYN